MNLQRLFARVRKTDVTDINSTVYFKLEEKTKREICQKLKIFDPQHLGIFQEAERMFSVCYGSIKGIEAFQCGLAPILGPSNCIRVFIPAKSRDIKLPVYFEGFPVIKIYENSNRTYRFMVDRVKNEIKTA